MTTTMQLIAKQTVGSGGASSVTFSNIPQTYTDLKLVMSTRNSRSDGTAFATVQFSFNGVTTNRSRRNLYNVSGTVSSDSGSDIISVSTSSSATASTFDNMEVYIPNYTSSNNKSMSIDSTTENNGTAVYQILSAGLWSSSSAINQITITPTSYNWTEFSTFYLYGISNSTTTQATTVPYASGGDVITTDGSYWYHAFKYSGTFTPLKALSCDYLIVAGGAGGISYAGGGAGGVQTATSQSFLANTSYVASVGAGGAVNANGGDSTFYSVTVNKGLKGTSTYGAAGTSGNGYTGGTGANLSNPYVGGGGAGAAANGSNNVSGTGGAGGIGLTSSLVNAMGAATTTGQLSSGNYYFGGGGGGGSEGSGSQGGAGGLGGGGTGSRNSSAPVGSAGTANTGGAGGGGDGGSYNNGYAGGSGIIIVRYAV